MPPDKAEIMRDVYFEAGEATVAGARVYSEAGAGDFGLGGVAVFSPEVDTRVMITTNTYEVFDIEGLASELSLQLFHSN